MDTIDSVTYALLADPLDTMDPGLYPREYLHAHWLSGKIRQGYTMECELYFQFEAEVERRGLVKAMAPWSEVEPGWTRGNTEGTVLCVAIPWPAHRQVTPVKAPAPKVSLTGSYSIHLDGKTYAYAIEENPIRIGFAKTHISPEMRGV